jgi:ABC-type multidrug transport system permease subunit
VYSVIVYWLVGFQADAGRFFWFLAILFLTLTMWTFLGINNVQITPTLQIANAFTSFVFGIMDLFNGFYRPQPMIPAGWIWLYWANPISYTLYGLIVGELGESQQLMVDQSPPVSVAQFVRDYFGYKTSFMGYTALILAAFCAFFFAASTTALARIKWQNR